MRATHMADEYDGTWVYFEKIGGAALQTFATGRNHEIMDEWIAENCAHACDIRWSAVRFKDATDALMCFLRWR